MQKMSARCKHYQTSCLILYLLNSRRLWKTKWNKLFCQAWTGTFTSHNGQTHFRSLAANAERFLKFFWLFWGNMHSSFEPWFSWSFHKNFLEPPYVSLFLPPSQISIKAHSPWNLIFNSKTLWGICALFTVSQRKCWS